MREVLIIFTRIPLPKQTKTRMMPYLNGRECAKLHMCFLKDIAFESRKTAKDVYIFYTPEGPSDRLSLLWGSKATYRVQQGSGLGERMRNAFQTVFQAGYDACVLIGTDVPELKAEYLTDAFEQLKRKDVVLGATKDGGYYLIGMKQLHSAAFEKQTYGHETVFENTIAALADKGLTVGFVQKLQDMDTPEDLRTLLRRSRNLPIYHSRYTRKFLRDHQKISIIIPIYNERKTISHMQRQLYHLKDQSEIIFVDGGSTDGTLKKIKSEFKVIHSPKGRANQMNAGALESTGDILFFLHCDSKLPSESLAQIQHVMKRYQVGGFGIAYASKNFFMFTCRLISNFRMKYCNIIFGDQGIFIERNLFFEMKMFPDLPIMEDFQFSLNLKKAGKKIGITRNRIYTSDRRYPHGTLPKLRLMWNMYCLRKRYQNGESIQNIADDYRDIR